jgi:hypothetical protein
MMAADLRERHLACEGEAAGAHFAEGAPAQSIQGREQLQAGHDRHAEPAGPDDVDGWAVGQS